jgi:methenyltetrahydrofolate cyclohydrolase
LVGGIGHALDTVESPTEAFAGGSSSAISAAFAASLVTMTARASTDWEAGPGVIAQARTLRHRLLVLAVEDAEALSDARAALAQSQGGVRPPLGVVLARAADVPLAIANAAADVAELSALAAENVTPSVRPDAVAAAALAEAACASSAHLVDVNLATLPGDERRAAASAARAAAMDARTRAVASPD